MRGSRSRGRRGAGRVLMLAVVATAMAAPAAQADPAFPIKVVLPPGYHGSHRTYPVLYLFNVAYPGCEDESCPDVAPFVRFLSDQKVISVFLTNSGSLGDYTNWHDGTHPNERLITRNLIRHVDHTYRTRRNRANRAVAGISAGGYGAMLLASRHPDLFSSAAAFSGVVDIRQRDGAGRPIFELLTDVPPPPNPPTEPFRVWGDPATDDLFWRNANPRDLVGNLDGVRVFHSVGNGVSCRPDDAADGPGLVLEAALEALLRDQNDDYDQALGAADERHDYAPRCGVHRYPYWQEDFPTWFRDHLRFGGSSQRSFDFRFADPRFAVWGWRFRADPGRAPEFLEIKDASRHGLTLTGSGTTRVRTARYFHPHEAVTVVGAHDDKLREQADDSGRLRFTADLGPPHTEQQYTPAQEAQAGPDYFTTRSIVFRRHARDHAH